MYVFDSSLILFTKDTQLLLTILGVIGKNQELKVVSLFKEYIWEKNRYGKIVYSLSSKNNSKIVFMFLYLFSYVRRQ